MSGRTSWWSKDAAWHRRELIVELGEEFGAAGPLVVDVLSAWAQEQRDSGNVRGGYRVLAREAFTTPELAEAIVAKAAEIGALDDFEPDPDGRRFTCRVSGWDADQSRGRAAFRQAAQREKERDEPDLVTLSHAESRSVTEIALPDQTIPKQRTTAPSAQRSRGDTVSRSLAESVGCPRCGVAAGEKCDAVRGGKRESCHLERHHLVGQFLDKGAGAGKPPAAGFDRTTAKAAPGVAEQLHAEHFPDADLVAVQRAVFSLSMRRPPVPVTAAAVRERLHDVNGNAA